jgi:hypothetical protein
MTAHTAQFYMASSTPQFLPILKSGTVLPREQLWFVTTVTRQLNGANGTAVVSDACSYGSSFVQRVNYLWQSSAFGQLLVSMPPRPADGFQRSAEVVHADDCTASHSV